MEVISVSPISYCDFLAVWKLRLDIRACVLVIADFCLKICVSLWLCFSLNQRIRDNLSFDCFLDFDINLFSFFGVRRVNLEIEVRFVEDDIVRGYVLICNSSWIVVRTFRRSSSRLVSWSSCILIDDSHWSVFLEKWFGQIFCIIYSIEQTYSFFVRVWWLILRVSKIRIWSSVGVTCAKIGFVLVRICDRSIVWWWGVWDLWVSDSFKPWVRLVLFHWWKYRDILDS